MSTVLERSVVRDYLQLSNQLSRTLFVSEHPEPMLVRASGEMADASGGFMTRASSSLHEPHSGTSLTKPEQIVIVISKRPGSPYEDRVGVGRTRNTDVHIPDHGVSKYHAYFSQTDKKVWQITDAGSKNGTFVNGKRLEARETTELKNAVRVAFGAAQFRFYTPEGFYDYLKEPAW